MLNEMAGKQIRVTVPKREVKRVRKVMKNGPKLTPTPVWLIDFRGIRSTNCVEKSKKKRRYSGQKSAFNSPEKLQREIDAYFESCYGFMFDKNGNLKYDKNGEPIRYQKKPFTISGLALSIGISTQTLNRYCIGTFDNDMDSDPNLGTYRKILVRAKQRIESYVESRLYDRDGTTGARFVLDSSFGWTTQKEASEIQEKQFNMWIREQEFELKQKLMTMGAESEALEIKIVRKGEE